MLVRRISVIERVTEIMDETEYSLPEGSMNADAVQFELDEEWNGLTLTALFTLTGGSSYAVLLDAEKTAKIPYEISGAGGKTYTVTLVGVKDSVRLVTTPLRLFVSRSDYTEESGSPSSVTPTVAEQLTQRVVQSESIAQGAATSASASAASASAASASAASAATSAGSASASAAASAADAKAVKDAYDAGLLKGEQGIKGDSGVSPTVGFETVSGGVWITVTDASGAHTAFLKNGTNGADGRSPTVRLTPSSSGTLITVNDVNGTRSAFVYNGAAGKNGSDATVTAESIERALGFLPTRTADVSEHNTSVTAHSDIRLLVSGLTERLNALADSDDTTLDQLSEVVAYIKANRGLIESVTTSKVSVSDIVNDLVTNVANKTLSAAMGVELKRLIDEKADAEDVPTKVSELENDSGYLTEHQDISGKQDVIPDLDTIRSGAEAGATALQSIPVATTSQVGAVKASNSYCAVVESTGTLKSATKSVADYASLNSNAFVSKGTLDNVLAKPSAMPTLSDSEKAAARERIGAYQKPTDGWVLKGTLTTDNKSDGLTVDLTGCTELLITGDANVTANSSVVSTHGNMVYNMFTTSKKYTHSYFRDSVVGFDCVFSKAAGSTTSVTCGDNNSGYCYVDGKKIAGITKLYFPTPSNVTECNIKIYAR